MIDKNRLSVASLLDFNTFDSIPSTFTDQHADTARQWSVNGTVNLKTDDNGDKYAELITDSSKMYISSGYFANQLHLNNFVFSIEFSSDLIRTDNILIGVSNATREYLTLSFNRMLLSLRTPNRSLSCKYEFDVGVKYLVTLIKKDSIFTLLVNGLIIGFFDDADFNDSLSTIPSSAIILGNGGITSYTSTATLRGRIYGFNCSYGKYNMVSGSFSELSNNILYHKVGGYEIDVSPLVTVDENNVQYVADTSSGSLMISDIKEGLTQVLSIDNGPLVTINKEVIGDDSNKININDNTMSAVDFEDGLATDANKDVMWTAEGGATVTRDNKIYGDYSLQLSKLGDCLSTTSNVFGTNDPYTLSFDMVYNSTTKGPSRTDNLASLFSKSTTHLSVDVDTGLFQTSIPYINIDNPRLRIGDINRYVVSYDGSATRIFVNGILYAIGGGKMNLSQASPLRFGYNESTALANAYGVSGVYDNINLQVKEVTDHTISDLNKDHLLLDLALDGVEGSKVITDSGITADPPIENYITTDLDLTTQPGLVDGLGTVGSISYSDGGALVNTSNYLYIDNVTLGNEPFVIEFDALATSQNASGYSSPLIQWGTGNDATDGFAIENYLTNNIMTFRTAYGSMTTIASNVEFNRYYNIKVSYNGSSTIVYVDGVPVPVQNGNGMGGTRRLLIGSGVGSWYNSRNKLIKSLRIYKGKSLHDVIIKPVGDAKLSTVNKFGGVSSLILNNVGDYLYTDKYDLNFAKGSNFTISFELIRNSAQKYDVVLANGSTDLSLHSMISINPSDHQTHPNKLYMFGDTNESGVRTIYTCSKFDIVDNIKCKVDIVVRDGLMYMYVDNKLDSTHVVDNDFNFSTNGTYIGYSVNDTPSSFTGNLKNIRIYDTNVSPTDVTNSLRLDFNNNITDIYKNSTWNHTGLTYSTVTAHSQVSGLFDQNTTLSTSSDMLNFDVDNFDVSFDIFESSKATGGEIFSSNISPTNADSIWFATSANATGLDFGDRNSLMGSLSRLNSTSFPNIFYSENIKRFRSMVLSTKNGVPAQVVFVPNTKKFNFVGGGLFTMGKPSTTFGNYSGFAGNIDNFEITRDVNQINELEVFRTSTSCTAAILKEDVVLTSVASNGIAVKNKDIPSTNSFKLNTKLKKGTGEMSIILGATDWSLTDMIAYIVSVSGSNLVLSRGLNPLSAPSLTPVSVYSQLDSTLTEYEITITVADGDVKVYVGDTLCISTVVDEQLLSNRVGFGAYFGAGYSIDYYTLLTLTDDQIFHRDWIDSTEIDIKLPIVDIPFKQSSINVGFSQITVNQNSALTHAVIEGVQCVRCESGKFVSIPQYNAFSLGLDIDFCIQIKFYYTDTQATNWKKIFSIVDNDKSIEMRFITGAGGVLYVWGTPTVNRNYVYNKWTTVTVFRRNRVIKCTVDDLTFDLSNKNVTGTQNVYIGNGALNGSTDFFNGYIADFKMFAGISYIPTDYNNTNMLNLTFEPTNKSYLFEDKAGRNILHPVNISQREYIDGEYGCKFDGASQYIQISNNDCLNFGYDDFVIKFKFRVVKDGTWNILIGNGSTLNDTNYSYIGVSDANDCVYLTIQGSSLLISSNKVNYDGINECIITRQGGLFTMILNGVESISISPSSMLNLNYAGVTKIGSTSVSSWVNHLFKGVIYEVQAARFTSNVDDLVNNSKESIKHTLTVSSVDGVEDVIKVPSSVNLDFVLGDDAFTVDVDGVSTVISQPVSNTDQNTITLSNFTNAIVYDHDVSSYEDSYVFEKYATQMPEIEVVNNVAGLGYKPTLTDVKFKGFVEGASKMGYTITDQFGVFVSSGIDDYSITNIDSMYDNYNIALDNGLSYIIPKSIMERGFISGVVDISKCKGAASKLKPSDMTVWCYVNKDQRFIGSYPVAGDGTYNIPNLDVHTRYDLIFKHNTRIIENISSSYRKPKRVENVKSPRIVNLDYVYDKNSKFVKYMWRYHNTVSFTNVKLYITDTPVIDSNAPFVELGSNVSKYNDYNVVHDHQYYVTIVATYEGNEYRSTQMLVNTYEKVPTVIESAVFNKTTGNISIAW